MSDQQDQEQNRSEQATPFKLAKAREKGAVARGTDLGYLVALTTFVAFIWVEGAQVRARVVDAARQAIVSAPELATGPQVIMTVSGRLIWMVMAALVWLPILVFAAVLTFELIQTGPVFSTETMRLDFSRLNPANGFKRIFSLRMLIETGKNLVKMALYATIGVLVIRYAWRVAVPTVVDSGRLMDAMAALGLRLLVFFVAGAACIAVLDQLVARGDFRRRMRMSRREIRREVRDREGDPRQKQRRKQLHRQYVKLAKSMRNIRDADVLITNPVHYAVALRYDANTMAAPLIVSQATNQHALRLKHLAFVYGVTTIQNPVLARALYQQGEIEKLVPEQLFRPVAEVYIAMRAAKTPSAPREADD